MVHHLLLKLSDYAYSDALHQLTRQQSTCDRFLFVNNDLHSGLGATMKMMSLTMLLAFNSRRVMLDAPSTYCKSPPHTMQCVYLPWSSCSPIPDCSIVHLKAKQVSTSSSRCVEISLKEFYASNIWYGTGAKLYRTNISYALTKVLASPRAEIVQCADDTIRRCGGAHDYAFVHIRDSPEKRLEQGKRLVTNTSVFIDVARRINLPLIWSTFNAKHIKMIQSQFPGSCFVNYKVQIHDDDPSNVLFSSACSAEVARKARAYVGNTHSMMTWLASNSQKVEKVYPIGIW